MKDRKSTSSPVMALALLFVVCAYFAAYLALLDEWHTRRPILPPDYRVGGTIAATFFWPAHSLDRHVIRNWLGPWEIEPTSKLLYTIEGHALPSVPFEAPDDEQHPSDTSEDFSTAIYPD